MLKILGQFPKLLKLQTVFQCSTMSVTGKATKPFHLRSVMKESNLMEMKLNQLERLLATKRINFRDSFYIIFSDYPTCRFIECLVVMGRESGLNAVMLNRLETELNSL